MLATVALHLVYEPAVRNQRPIAVARILDPSAIAAAARCAIGEAEIRVKTLANNKLERDKLNRLRNVLAVICPSIT